MPFSISVDRSRLSFETIAFTGEEMTTRPWIDPALGLIDVDSSRSLESLEDGTVSIVIPAHNEQETIGKVTREAFRAIELLGVNGEVIVSASGCTDATADLAAKAGAHVVESLAGKGNAMTAGIKASGTDIVCLIDGDFRYLGDEPLAVGLVKPILQGVAHATIADLYWRPIYPQLWLFGFFAPLAGRIFPELLPILGSTPWSGQRAALRELWPTELPEDFTSDLAILLHWHDLNIRLRPVATDDWVNPQRPKPDLMHKEFTLFADYALSRERINPAQRKHLETWFASVHTHMAEYRPDQDDPQQFERSLLRNALAELNRVAQPL